MMSQFFSRPNPFFPRFFAVVAFIALVLPAGPKDQGFLYFFAAWCALFPWAMHALNIRFGVDRHDGGRGQGGGDSGGYVFGDSGCGDGGGGDGGC